MHKYGDMISMSHHHGEVPLWFTLGWVSRILKLRLYRPASKLVVEEEKDDVENASEDDVDDLLSIQNIQ